MTLPFCLSMWVHSNPLMSHAGVTFISPPVVTPPPVAKSVSFTGYITMLWVRPLEMCLDPYKNWIQVDPVFEFLKLLLCCDVALSSPIVLLPAFSFTEASPSAPASYRWRSTKSAVAVGCAAFAALVPQIKRLHLK